MDFTVDEKFNNKPLRDFLRGGIQISRKTLTRLKSLENGILLNGERVTVRAAVHTGDAVCLALEDCENDENPHVQASGQMPPIIYEDEAIIAVNKPAGMPTHTSYGHYGDALSNAVCAYFNEQGKPFVFRAVNRLDRDTSGVVLIAKNRYYSSILSGAMTEGKFKKQYIAVVQGKTEPSGEITGYIAREGESIIKRRLLSAQIEGSDYSKTEYTTLDSTENASVLLVSPITGRTHQIRLHMSSIGHPIMGDTMYGSASEHIQRQALHAYLLTFPSPVTGKMMTVTAPIPDDIRNLMKIYSLTEKK